MIEKKYKWSFTKPTAVQVLKYIEVNTWKSKWLTVTQDMQSNRVLDYIPNLPYSDGMTASCSQF